MSTLWGFTKQYIVWTIIYIFTTISLDHIWALGVWWKKWALKMDLPRTLKSQRKKSIMQPSKDSERWTCSTMCTLCPMKNRRKVVRFDSFVDTISYSEYSQYASTSRAGSIYQFSNSLSSFCGHDQRLILKGPSKVRNLFVIIYVFFF